MEAKELISYKGVDISHGDVTVLSSVDLRVSQGDFIYLLGKVGSGKSSFLKSLYAELRIEAGEAHIFDYDLRKIKRTQIPFLRRKIGIIFQDFQLLPDRNVFDNLAFVLKATGWKNKEAIENQVLQVLQQVNMLMLQGESNVTWQIVGSELVVRLKDNAKGVVSIPNIKQLIVSKVSCNLTGFNLDSLQLSVAKESGKIVLRNSQINYLNASANNHGQLSIEKNTRIDKLNLLLQSGTFATAIDIDRVSKTITPDSRIELSGDALQWIAQKK